MAAHTPFEAHKVVVKARVSGSMDKICALTTRSFSRSVQANTVTMPRDCDDPDVIPGTARIATGIDSTISGEARYHKELRVTLDALLGVTTDMEFHVPGTGAQGGGYYAGAYKLMSIDLSGEDGDHLVASISFELDDADMPQWTQAA